MARGFTKTGQPIMGRKYIIKQGDFAMECTVVGKLVGKGGNADLVGVILEDPETGGRDTLAWPIEPVAGAEPIHFWAAP